MNGVPPAFAACVGGGDKSDETFRALPLSYCPERRCVATWSKMEQVGFEPTASISQRCSSIGIHRRLFSEATKGMRVLTRFPARAGFEPAGCQCTPIGIRLVFRIWFCRRPGHWPEPSRLSFRASDLAHDRSEPLTRRPSPMPQTPFAGKDSNLHGQIQNLLTYRLVDPRELEGRGCERTSFSARGNMVECTPARHSARSPAPPLPRESPADFQDAAWRSIPKGRSQIRSRSITPTQWSGLSVP